MSHHFTRPAAASRDERAERANERLIAELAAKIGNQALLDQILEQASSPEMAAGILDKIRPHLSFQPYQEISDCPTCGMRRGSVIAHECI